MRDKTRYVRLRMMKAKRIIGAVAGALALYVGVYVVLSVQGSYVPLAWGVSWVKFYTWAPRGFTSGPAGTEWHPIVVYSFLPLLGVDRHLWHTENRMREGKYPVNRKLDEVFEKGRQHSHASEATSRKLAVHQR